MSSEGPKPETQLGIGSVADKLLAPVAVIDPDSTVLYVNAAAAHAIGQEPAWLVGRRMLPLVHPDDRARVRRELRGLNRGLRSGGATSFRIRSDPAQSWRVFESIADNLMDDPNIGGILLSTRDITAQVTYQQKLKDAAYRDALTGLPNRAALDETLDQLVAGEGEVSVALVGIDRFTLVNDSLGYATADEVLKTAAQRIRTFVPQEIIVGRFAGDVMAVLIPGASEAQTTAVLWQLVSRLGESMFIAGYELRMMASVGVVQREATSSAESLMRDAGVALNRAKAEGGARVVRFEAAMREAATARFEMEADLRRAISLDELRLALQPIVNLDDETAVGSEALLRWQRRARPVEPGAFIPVAEETGLIVPIGDWVMDRAAAMVASAQSSRVSVNLSPQQLGVPGFHDRIARVLARHQIAPANLGFEVTETAVIEDFEHTALALARIRQLGCPVGLDDFGTGFSSLGYLRRLPVDFIKIDRSLTAGIDVDAQARAIVGAIVTMANALGLTVVAEGVETRSQALVLKDLGCPLAQGYLFGRPAVAPES